MHTISTCMFNVQPKYEYQLSRFKLKLRVYNSLGFFLNNVMSWVANILKTKQEKIDTNVKRTPHITYNKKQNKNEKRSRLSLT